MPWTGADRDTPAMKTLMNWRKMLECKQRKLKSVSEGVTQLTFNDCTRGGEIVVYRVEGLGHVWPGGANTISRWLGHSSCKLLATEVIWQFFKAHPRLKPVADIHFAKLTARATATSKHQ